MFLLTRTTAGDHRLCQRDIKTACLKADAYKYCPMDLDISYILCHPPGGFIGFFLLTK